MKGAISKKLLVLLGVTLVVAGFGVRSLLSLSGGATESGFDGPPPLPLDGSSADDLEPYEFRRPPNPRNPFAVVGVDPVEIGPDADTNADADAGSELPDP